MFILDLQRRGEKERESKQARIEKGKVLSMKKKKKQQREKGCAAAETRNLVSKR